MRARSDFHVRTARRSDAPTRSEIAKDPRSGGDVLVRTLDEELAGNRIAEDAFLAEIEAGSRIPEDHPRLLGLVASEAAGTRSFLAREYSKLGTLRERLVAGPPLSPQEILGVVSWLAAALDDLAALGLSHGDPSPYNIVLFEGGRARLADAASCRKTFADGRSQASAAEDRARAIALLRDLMGRASGYRDDALAPELQRIAYSNAQPEGKLAALRRLVKDESAPVLRQAPAASITAPAAGAPIRVLLAVGPFRTPEARARAERIASPFLRSSAPDAHAALGPERITFEIDFPDPCQAVSSDLREGGARVTACCRVGGVFPTASQTRDGQP